MILTVTLNVAVDVTYHLERIRWRETSRVENVSRRAGGKGVNVARVLHALGHEAVVTGFAGGATGAAARAELAEAGLIDATVEVADASRTSLMVVEADGGATGFSELGPEVSATEWQRMLERFRTLLDDADGVVLAGSLPPGVPVDCYAQLIGLAAEAAVPLLLDAEGEALARGAAARPTLVKVNAAELATVVNDPSVVDAAQALRQTGPPAVVVSDGERGLVAVAEDGCWRTAPPRTLRGNPTGAGDAASAALIVGTVRGRTWPERLSDAVALSAAAVCAPLAGSFDSAVYEELRGLAVSPADSRRPA